MGAQKTIAAKILEGGADYVLAQKGNQGNLHDDIKLSFDGSETSVLSDRCHDFFETVYGDHGRIETRSYWTTYDLEGLVISEWAGLKAIGIVERIREVDDKISKERSYFLLSREMSAAEFGNAVRSHWALEVTFREDESRVRKDHAPENFNTLRKIALALLKNTKTKRKRGVATRRLMAGWSNNFLTQVLSVGLT